VNTAVAVLVSGGGGAIIASFLTAVFSLTVNRASAVKLLSEAAAETGKENKVLHDEIKKLREAIIHLTDAVDEIIPLLETDSPHRQHLSRTNTAAKLAV
jgi:phage-related protein